MDGNATQPDNLYAHKDKDVLSGTFTTAAASGSDYPDWYWSSTEHRDYPSGVRSVRFSDGYEVWPVRTTFGLVAALCAWCRWLLLSSVEELKFPLSDPFHSKMNRGSRMTLTTEACLTIEAVFDAYFDCRKAKRNSVNQLRFETISKITLCGYTRSLQRYL